jgi:hypothetical protein
MCIDIFEFKGEGMTRVYENEKWTVGIKNYKVANDIANIDCIERHNQTDELFVLIGGSCTLVYANETNGIMEFSAVKMQVNKVYSIPKSLWHNTVTNPDTKMILIEDSSTSMKNSDVLTLNQEQIKALKVASAKA